MKVHHFVATWEPGAVGAHVVHAREALADAGMPGNVYAGVDRGGMPVAARAISSYPAEAAPEDVLLYQHAIGSTVADFVVARTERLVVNYHNITPSEFFDAWDRPLADALDWGRSQLRPLARRATLGIADSPFNEHEMRAVGFTRSEVVPVLFDPERSQRATDTALAAALRSAARGHHWLFAGRLVPNKAQHELIKAFAMYRRSFDPGARLWLVGRSGCDRYRDALAKFIERAELRGAVELVGGVSDAELGAYYDAADVFVCVSRHEGFCVPVIEAMAHGLPVVARATTAVADTVAGAGLLLPDDAPTIDVAAAASTVCSDGGTRQRLVDAGRLRAAVYSPARTRAQLVDALRPLTAEAAAA
jgi:glycosyltransferase involved in cell wall biosynthesis